MKYYEVILHNIIQYTQDGNNNFAIFFFHWKNDAWSNLYQDTTGFSFIMQNLIEILEQSKRPNSAAKLISWWFGMELISSIRVYSSDVQLETVDRHF